MSAVSPDGDTVTSVRAGSIRDDSSSGGETPSTGETPTAAAPPALGAPATAAPTGPPPSPDRAAAGLFQPGYSFGRYRIIKLLGTGGMGAVYQAWDEELGLLVALKVIRPDAAADAHGTSQIEKRFKRELVLARQVTHRNVIRIHDLGEIDGIKYITMQFVNGANLAAVLRDRGGKLPVRDALRIARQVASGLAAAHGVGVVHRDLKPGNIMLDDEDQVFIVDFGIARSLDSGLTGNAVVGTLAYMAPEQAKGAAVDHRADIYSFGLVLLDMLIGSARRVNPESAAVELIGRMQQAPPPVRSIDATIPEAVEQVITRCLYPEPAQRYATTADLVADLEALNIEGHRTGPVPWPTPLPVSAARRPSARLVGAVAAALVVAVAAGAVVVTRGTLWRRPSAAAAAENLSSLAVLPFRNASGDASLDWLGDSVSEMLSGDVAQGGGFRVIGSDRLSRLLADLRVSPSVGFDTTTIRRIGEFSSAKVVVSGKYFKSGGQAIRLEATLHDVALNRDVPLNADARDANAIVEAVQKLAGGIRDHVGAERDSRAESIVPLSKSAQAVHEYNLGLQLARDARYSEALKHFEAATAADTAFAGAYSKSAEMYAKLRQGNKAEEASRTAVQLASQLPNRERLLIEARNSRLREAPAKAIEAYKRVLSVTPHDTDAQFELGDIYESTGAYDDARNQYRQVLDVDPNNVDALFAFGRVEIRRKNPQGALDPLSRGLNLATQFNNDEARATFLNALGIAYKRLDRPEDARQYYEQSIAIKRRLGQKGGIASTLTEIGQIDRQLGKPDEAQKTYQEALAIRREIGDKKGVGNTLIDLASLAVDRGRYDDALTGYREALQIERELGDQGYEALCLNNIGAAYLAKGVDSEALTYFERALEIREKLKQATDTAETLHNIGEVSLRQGHYQAALENYTKALDLYRSAGDKRKTAILSYSIGNALELEGRFSAALKAKQEALTTLRDLHDRSFWIAEILSGYGQTLNQLGKFDDARTSLDEAMTLARQLQNGALVAQVFNFNGLAASYRGDWRTAAAAFTEAQREASRAGDARQSLVADINLAKAAIAEGRYQPAIARLEPVIVKAEQAGAPNLALEARVALAEARGQTGNTARALDELKSAIARAQDAGLVPLVARSRFVYAGVLRTSHQADAAAREYAEVVTLLDQIAQEAGDPKLLEKRADFDAMRRDAQKSAKPVKS